jgi:hypothetical protein
MVHRDTTDQALATAHDDAAKALARYRNLQITTNGATEAHFKFHDPEHKRLLAVRNLALADLKAYRASKGERVSP